MTGNKGFSLLEVMVSLGMLSIGLLSIPVLSEMGYRALAIANQNTHLAELARNKMESLRAARPAPMNVVEDLAGVTRKWSIEQSGSDPRLWVITVVVASTRDTNRSARLQSLLFY